MSGRCEGVTSTLDIARPCVVCGASERRAGVAPVEVCASCGHGDASSAVGSGEVVNEAPDRAADRPTRLQRAQVAIARRCRAHPGPLVDVGCANGGFLRHAMASGTATADSYGIEISAVNADAARRRGLRVTESLAEVAPGALVTFWHSAEHVAVADLVALLTEIRERSRGAASVLVAVPNGDSVQARAFGARWAFHDPDAHVSVFSRESLGRVLDRGGFRPERWFRTPTYGTFAAAQSALNLVRPRNELYEAMQRRGDRLGPLAWSATAAAALAVAPVAALAGLPELAPRRASVLTVHAVTAR